jgi:hypothetical protein
MKMKILNRFLLTVVCLWGLSAQAALYQIPFISGQDVAPGNAIGCLGTRANIGLTDSTVTDVRVQLHVNPNGDLYVYLAHASSFVALLNHSGCMGSHPFSNGDTAGGLTQSQLDTSSVSEPMHVALGIFGGLCAAVVQRGF